MGSKTFACISDICKCSSNHIRLYYLYLCIGTFFTTYNLLSVEKLYFSEVLEGILKFILTGKSNILSIQVHILTRRLM